MCSDPARSTGFTADGFVAADPAGDSVVGETNRIERAAAVEQAFTRFTSEVGSTLFTPPGLDAELPSCWEIVSTPDPQATADEQNLL
ncbi:MAG: hypothetical protein OER95_15930 [Acidimicrobiia bacterium]|nr:hypothetical protein [Acidimicrobiia bacterium]